MNGTRFQEIFDELNRSNMRSLVVQNAIKFCASRFVALGTISHVSEYELRLEDARGLLNTLAAKNNGGALLCRHLLGLGDFDPDAVPATRMDHKLVQTEILNHYRHGTVPNAVGLTQFASYLVKDGLAPSDEPWIEKDFICKEALSEGTGEANSHDSVASAIQRAVQTIPLADELSLANEHYMLQRRLEIRKEFRVHSFEDRVVESLVYHRYGDGHPLSTVDHSLISFVQSIIDTLPPALLAGFSYGWDVALLADGQYQVVEANPSGMHPIFRPGFHCSGVFQVVRSRIAALSRLIKFIQHSYGTAVTVVSDSSSRDDASAVYWWTGQALKSEHPRSSHGCSWSLLLEHTDDHSSSIAVGESPVHIDDYVGSIQKKVHVLEDAEVMTVVSLFDVQATASPDAIAVVANDRTLSYKELSQASDIVAALLRSHGLPARSIIGLCVRRSSELLINLLGIWKAGHTYLPLDPSHPFMRLEYFCKVATPALILSDDASLSVAEKLGLKAFIPNLSAVHNILMNAVSCTEHKPTLEDIAYVIFTSGSTGGPKGVKIRHMALANLLLDMRSRLQVVAEDNIIAGTTIGFDISLLELLVPLISGSKVYLASDECVASLDALRAFITESRATIYQTTPTMWALLLENELVGSSLRIALCGGEALSESLAIKLMRRCCRVLNLYGPTETTIWSAAWWVQDGPVLLGSPLRGTSLMVLDSSLRPVSVGETGELFICGLGISAGYMGDTAATAEAFIANPYSAEPGGIMYRTGDQIKVVAIGRFCFQGRNDGVLKINGVRIGLGEIEDAIAHYPGISSVTVTTQSAEVGAQRIVAHIVSESPAEIDLGELRRFLSDRLPSAGVPKMFQLHGDLPRTLSGKVDREALRLNSIMSKEAGADLSDTEVALLGIWGNQLGLVVDSKDSAFLELGGDSLLAVRCVNRIRSLFHVEVSMWELFSARGTIREMARLIEEIRANDDAAAAN